MSDENLVEGRNCYMTGSPKERAWFERQWSEWPERTDKRYTTNISFLYGGVTGYRDREGKEPDMSPDFRSHVEWHDRHQSA